MTVGADFGKMDGLAGEIAAAVSKMEGRLQQYDQDLTPLKGQWTGEASLAYQKAKNDWTTAINDLKSLLSKTGIGVQDARSLMSDVETKNRAAFGG